MATIPVNLASLGDRNVIVASYASNKDPQKQITGSIVVKMLEKETTIKGVALTCRISIKCQLNWINWQWELEATGVKSCATTPPEGEEWNQPTIQTDSTGWLGVLPPDRRVNPRVSLIHNVIFHKRNCSTVIIWRQQNVGALQFGILLQPGRNRYKQQVICTKRVQILARRNLENRGKTRLCRYWGYYNRRTANSSAMKEALFLSFVAISFTFTLVVRIFLLAYNHFHPLFIHSS